MALSSAFGFTNTSDTSEDVTLKAIGEVTNYGKDISNGTECVLVNRTTPVDRAESISLRSRVLNNGVKTSLLVQNPSKVNSAIEYGVRLDAILTTTDTVDPTFRVDEPIVCSITFRHPRSGNITASHVETMLIRALSSLFNETSNSWRINDLMRGAEEPVTD